MFMIGYVTETQEVYDQVKQWLQDRVEYKDIMMLGIVGTVAIIKNTYLDKNQDKFGVIWLNDAGSSNLKNSLFNWTTSNNENTPAKRAEWLKMTQNYATELGFHIVDEAYGHEILHQLASGPLTADLLDLQRKTVASNSKID